MIVPRSLITEICRLLLLHIETDRDYACLTCVRHSEPCPLLEYETEKNLFPRFSLTNFYL